jgi:hypothetical protein
MKAVLTRNGHRNGTKLTCPQISQSRLRAFLAVKEEAAGLAARQQEMRDELFGNLEAGWGVEAGPITAGIRTTEQRRFSADALADLLGKQQMEQLKSQLPVSISRALIVE